MSEALSSMSSPSPLVVLECIEVGREVGSDARLGSGLFPFAPASRSCILGLGMGARLAPSADSSLGMATLGVGGCEVTGRLLRSRGRPMLVRLLSGPVDRSTTRDDGAGLWRLRRCSGRVNRGYSSRVPGRCGLSPNWERCTGTLGRTGARGDELTGFHRREAGRRGDELRKSRLKRRVVRLQRAGSGAGAGAGARGDDEDGPWAADDAVVATRARAVGMDFGVGGGPRDGPRGSTPKLP